jgi:hypothetical protein
VSEARQMHQLPTGVAAQTLLDLIAMARVMWVRAVALK